MDALLTKLAEDSVFLALLVSLWFYTARTLERKDKEINELNNKVLDAFQAHTKIMEQMKTTISTNTDLTKTLSDRIFLVLTDKK